MMYKPFGYDTIPTHIQGYRIIPKHIAEQFPHYSEMTKEQRVCRYKMCHADLTYNNYYGPFK